MTGAKRSAPNQGLARGLWSRAYLLLTLTALAWGGNAVAARLAVGEVSPMALTNLRWVGVVLILAATVGPRALREAPVLLPRWRSILLMGALGFTAFNALFYAAGHHTSGVNLTIIQGAIPVAVLIGGLLVYGVRIRPLQVAGMAVTLGGVALVASKGHLETLLSLGFNIGDVYMMVACLFYAGYTLGLRDRPPVNGLVFFAALAGVAFLTSLPLLAYEVARGEVQWPTPKGWAILSYVAVFPSLLSQILFMRGVELIGPARAGLFVNLVPVFGAGLSVLLLGEPFRWYHGAALALVLGGIWLAERGRG